MHALTLERSLTFVEAIGYQFRRLGVECHATNDTHVALSLARLYKPVVFIANADLVVSEKQIEHLARVRKETDALIMLLGDCDDPRSTAIANRVKAEQIVPAPVPPHKLIKNIRQALYRHSSQRLGAPAAIDLGDLVIDPDRFEIRVGRRRVILSVLEMEILYCLALDAESFVSREKLVNCVWCSELSSNTSAVVNAHMRVLRDKIEPDRQSPRYLLTKRGVGYMLTGLVLPPESAAAGLHLAQAAA